MIICYRGDPLSNVHLEFSSREAAVDYCEKNGKENSILISRFHLFKIKKALS